jgi:chromosome segregation ATPase
MQKQLISMTDEKFDMIAQIRTFQESNKQLDVIREHLGDLQSQIAREQRSRQLQLEKKRMKIAAANEELSLPRRVSWDDKRLSKLESSLQESIVRCDSCDEQISSLCLRDAADDARDRELDAKLGELDGFFSRCHDVAGRVRSFGSLALSVGELESRFAGLLRKRKKGSKRVQNRRLMLSSLGQSIEGLQRSRDDKETALKTLASALDVSHDSVDEELRFEQARLAAAVAGLTELERTLGHECDAASATVETESEANLKLDEELAAAEREVAQLTAEMDQFKVERDIMIGKKTSLTQQLQKSIKKKVTDITRARNNSPFVQRLVQAQEKHWVERQRLYETYSEVTAAHQEVTQTVARKALILSELQAHLRNLHYTGDPFAALHQAYAATQRENRTLGADIARAARELELTEYECIDIRRQLAAIED